MPGFVIGSVKLFEKLLRVQNFNLYGVNGSRQSARALIEVYPGAAWPLLAGKQRLLKKTYRQGRASRYDCLVNLGIRFPSDFSLQTLPTHDHLDATLAAYIGYLFAMEKVDFIGVAPFEDVGTSTIREGFIVQPTYRV